MKNLIIPMCGNSKRFPNVKPKWMLTHPITNRFMGIESIMGLNLDFFDKIYYVVLEEHENKFHFLNGFREELKKLGILNKTTITTLSHSTQSQSETVYNLISQENISGFIFIKDCDNYYECNINSTENQVVYYDLNDVNEINPKNKSYLQLDHNQSLLNIVEKKVISSTFSVGGYGFKESSIFCETFENLKDYEGECYVSNIIFQMLLESNKFIGNKCINFKDWGTLDSWNKYKNNYKCLFLDIDGTLIENSSCHFPPYIGEGSKLVNNCDLITNLYEEGKVYIVLTTSRPEECRDITEDELRSKNIPYHQLVMNLPHCKRVLINDYSNSNPYPSASAVNIERNSDKLNVFLNQI
jgi:hypothetical protein